MARGDKPTLRSIARLAEVSVTTVSDALNGTGRLSDEVRDRVAGIAREVGYVPNAAARNLRRARTGVIGFYLDPRSTGLSYYSAMVMALFHLAQERRVVIELVGPSDLRSADLRARFDGIVFSDPVSQEVSAHEILSSGVPVVTIERPGDDLPAPAGVVHSQHGAALTDMLDCMAAGGARRPVLLTMDDDWRTDWSRQIDAAYDAWCAAGGIEPVRARIPLDAGPDRIDPAVRAVLAAHPDVDGFLCARDGIAVRAAGIVEGEGRRVGVDFSLASCLDDRVLRYCVPPIAAIDLDPAGAVQRAFTLLFEILDERGRGAETAAAPRAIEHPVRLVDRASVHLTAAPRPR